MTSTPPETEAGSDRALTFLDWTRINNKALTIGGIIVLVAAAGFWFYTRSRQLQIANAERAFGSARQAVESGNLPLAQSDLQRVYTRYESTSAGVQAALLLAQV